MAGCTTIAIIMTRRIPLAALERFKSQTRTHIRRRGPNTGLWTSHQSRLGVGHLLGGLREFKSTLRDPNHPEHPADGKQGQAPQPTSSRHSHRGHDAHGHGGGYLPRWAKLTAEDPPSWARTGPNRSRKSKLPLILSTLYLELVSKSPTSDSSRNAPASSHLCPSLVEAGQPSTRLGIMGAAPCSWPHRWPCRGGKGPPGQWSGATWVESWETP